MTTYSAITDDEVVKLMIFCFDNFVITGGTTSCGNDMVIWFADGCVDMVIWFVWTWLYDLQMDLYVCVSIFAQWLHPSWEFKKKKKKMASSPMTLTTTPT